MDNVYVSCKVQKGQFCLTHLSQWNSQGAHTTSTITNSLSSNITVVLHPIQNLLYGLCMSISDIHLYRVDIVTFTVNFIPAVESFRIEILADFGLVIHDLQPKRYCRLGGRKKGRGTREKESEWNDFHCKGARETGLGGEGNTTSQC